MPFINFSTSFRALWAKLFQGVDLDQYYENLYLEKLKKNEHLKSNQFFRYHTGRLADDAMVEDPKQIFKVYNDLKTTPTQATIDRATQFFQDITRDIQDEDLKVKAVAAWVNDHARYETDSERWGRLEYWSSPFDLWQQYLTVGYFQDDCDGSAAFIYWACRLVGIPAERLYVWDGDAFEGKTPNGHANVVYYSMNRPPAHVEGSWYPDLNQANWLGEVFEQSTMYRDTRFMFNENEVLFPNG